MNRTLIIVLLLLLGSIYLNILQYNTPRFDRQCQENVEKYLQWQEEGSDLGTADENF